MKEVIGEQETGDIDNLHRKFATMTQDWTCPRLRARFNSASLGVTIAMLSFGVALAAVKVVSTLYIRQPADIVSKPVVVAVTGVLCLATHRSLRYRSARSVISTALFVLAGSVATSYGYFFILTSLAPASTLPLTPADLSAGPVLTSALVATGVVVFVAAFVTLASIRPRIARSVDGSGDACYQIMTVLYFLDVNRFPFYARRDRTALALTLERIAIEVEFSISGHLPGLLTLNPDVQRRMSGAAEQLRQMRTWVTLPQRSTPAEMRRVLLGHLCSIFTGKLHYLPFAEPRPKSSDIASTVRRVLIGATAGALPSVMILAANSLGIVPDAWRETLTAIGGVSLILGIAAAVKPSSTKAVMDAQEMVGKIRRGSSDKTE